MLFFFIPEIFFFFLLFNSLNLVWSQPSKRIIWNKQGDDSFQHFFYYFFFNFNCLNLNLLNFFFSLFFILSFYVLLQWVKTSILNRLSILLNLFFCLLDIWRSCNKVKRMMFFFFKSSQKLVEHKLNVFQQNFCY